MKKGIIFAVILTSIGIIGHFGAAQSKAKSSFLQISDVEAITTCELPDGYRANGHCVSNDRNQYFCSNLSGTRDCVQ